VDLTPTVVDVVASPGTDVVEVDATEVERVVLVAAKDEVADDGTDVFFSSELVEDEETPTLVDVLVASCATAPGLTDMPTTRTTTAALVRKPSFIGTSSTSRTRSNSRSNPIRFGIPSVVPLLNAEAQQLGI
jgi:hypothetical protein